MSAHVHGHAGGPIHDPAAVARHRTAVRWMLAFVVPTALATVVGLVVLWPPSGPSAAERAAGGSIPPGTKYRMHRSAPSHSSSPSP